MRRVATIGCSISLGLAAFATPALGMGEPSLVEDIAPGPDDSSIGYPAAFDGRLYFNADDGTGTSGRELWVSDGTEAGTKLFMDIFAGPESSFPIGMTNAFGELIFRAADEEHGTEPWAWDGGSEGPRLVTDIYPGQNGVFPNSSGPCCSALADGRTFFQANDGTGAELWVYEGAPASTTLVKDLNPVPGNPGVQGTMLAVGDTVYFGGDDNTGLKLWKSDGTEAGTVRVSNQPFVSVSALVGLGGKLLFAGDDGDNGRELWISDGTDEGTVMLEDIRPGSLSSHPANAVELDGTILFTATDESGTRLWRTDGTEEGTQLVGGGIAASGALAVVEGMAYFAGHDGDNDRELWVSDGTDDGTKLVADISATGSSSPGDLTAIDGRLFFSANNGVDGIELWTSTGTEDGTEMVADINDAAVGSSSPEQFTQVGNDVFFVAHTDAKGRELWRLQLDVPPVAVNDAATVVEDDAATAIPVLANDTDADEGPISVESVTQAANGTVLVTGGGSGLTYRPDPDYCNSGAPTDTEDFAYELAPGGDVALVHVTVTCVDDPPRAVDDSATVVEDAAATAIAVLANDTDVDGGASKSVASVTQPANGTVAVADGGTGLTYRPAANYCNDGAPADVFTYALSPGGDTATVAVRVSCVADPGTAVAARTAKVKKGVARLRLRCRGESRCKGRVTLTVKRRRAGKRPVRKVIGAKRFAIRAGKTRTVRIRLNRTGRARLRRSPSGRLRVKLRGRGVKPRTVVLRAAR